MVAIPTPVVRPTATSQLSFNASIGDTMTCDSLGIAGRRKGSSMPDRSPSQQIDDIIEDVADWRGRLLSQLRALIQEADPAVVEEVKWKKPSKPLGSPVWSHDGILCVGDTLKSAVRLTFPKGAQIDDPKKLFNARLDSNTNRAIDFHEDSTADGPALKAIIVEAVRVNTSKAR